MKLIAIGVVALAIAGCDKPSDESCRRAILNMQKVRGSESREIDIDGQVRRCRGGSTKTAVECAINAKTVEDLAACEKHKPSSD